MSTPVHTNARRLVSGAMVVSGSLVGWQGLRYLIDPASVVAGMDVAAQTVDELHVLRAGYGGVLVAVAVFALVGAWWSGLRRPALFTLAVSMAGLSAGRIVSIAVDGPPSDGLARLLVVEVALLLVALACLMIDGDRAAR